MKNVKSLGSIMVVAILAMALLGPSLAMGENTALCKADEESKCSSPISHIHYVANDLEILTSTMNYKCDVLLLATVGELGAPQVLEGEFTYTNCNNGCSREIVNGPAILYFLKTGHEKAEVVGEESEIRSLCSGINCVYSLEGLIGDVKGPLLSTANNGEYVYWGQELTKVSGLFCPTIAKLDAKFEPLSSTYISS